MISTFWLFINENSMVNDCDVRCICHYGPQVMKFEPVLVIWPNFYGQLLVTILAGFLCILKCSSVHRV